jgi:phosphoribosyl 1,2-cyclic phosphodiesterase
MKLIFAGTRGEIESRTQAHDMHTALVVGYRRRRVMIDCGRDWLERQLPAGVRAIVLTHAHPDHAWGLSGGCDLPVYATRQTIELIKGFGIRRLVRVEPRRPFEVRGITFEAFEVEHSIRCPAVSYRVTAGKVAVHYGPDVVFIHDRDEALAGVKLYIGDGATLKRSFVRRRGERLIGHSPVTTQLGWCAKVGVAQAIITHCGAQIVDGDEKEMSERVAAWGRELGVKAEIARDGMERVVR